MLQDIRQSTQGTTAKIVIGLIVLSFAGFGIQSILLDGGGGSVAEVNGEGIAPEELQQAVYTQRQRLIAMMGQNLDPAMLDEARISGQALEGLIGRKLLTQSAEQMDLAVSEREIGAQVSSMEQFQANGKFSPDVYKNALAAVGFTPGSYKRALRDDIVVNQVRTGLAGSEFSTASEVALNARVVAEQRDLRYLTIEQDAFAATDAPSDEEISAWYDANQDAYYSEESVDIEYLELTAEDFYAPVEENLVLEAYEQARSDHQFQPRSKVSHILLIDEGDKPLAERIAAVKARLAEGAEFADVAREFSDDAGSASQGGDLGYTSGDAFPEEMEKAISLLEPGDVSEPVETPAGTHIIKVTDREEVVMPSLEELRPELEMRIQQEEAAVELVKAVELLRDISFNADDLDGPAAELDLDVASATGIGRNPTEGLFGNASLLEAAYSEDVLEGGHNSDVLELADDRYVVLRVVAHHESELMPLETVRDDVIASVNAERARAALSAEAERVQAELRAGRSIEELAGEAGYDWQVELGADRRNINVPFDVLNQAFELPSPAEGDSSVGVVYSADGDATVVELIRVRAGDFASLNSEEKARMQRQTLMEYGTLVNTEYERGLRERAEINTVL